MKTLTELKAELAEQNNRGHFRGLYDENRRVLARLVEGRFGPVWMLHDEENARYGKRYVTCGARSKTQKDLGLSEHEETADAIAVQGQGGCAIVVRANVFGADAERVKK